MPVKIILRSCFTGNDFLVDVLVAIKHGTQNFKMKTARVVMETKRKIRIIIKKN